MLISPLQIQIYVTAFYHISPVTSMNIEDINIHIMFSSTSPSYLLLFFYPGYVRLEVKMNNRNGEKSSKQFDLQDGFEIEMGSD